MSARLADSITGNQIVKGFAAEPREDESFAALVAQWTKRTLISWYRGSTVGLLQAMVLIVMQAALLGCGLSLWSKGRMTTGDVVSLIGIQGLINGYLRDIGEHVRNLQRAVNEMEDVVAFAAAEPEVVDAAGARPLAVTRGEIVFDPCASAIRRPRKPLYEDFSMRSAPASASASSAPRRRQDHFRQAAAAPVRSRRGPHHRRRAGHCAVTQESLRRAIGIVAQEPILFHRPLGENIAYGRARSRALRDRRGGASRPCRHVHRASARRI